MPVTTPRNHIHCRHCLLEKPANQSPREWTRLDVVLTDSGLEVSCKRCRRQVAGFTPESLQKLPDNPPLCDCCPGGRHATQN